MFPPIIRIQEKDSVLSTKAIIETHSSEVLLKSFKKIIEKTTIRVNYTTGTVSNLTLEDINCQKEGSH